MHRLVAIVLIPCLLLQVGAPMAHADSGGSAPCAAPLFEAEALSARLANSTDQILSRSPRLWEFHSLSQEPLWAGAGMAAGAHFLPTLYFVKGHGDRGQPPPPSSPRRSSAQTPDPRGRGRGWLARHKGRTGLLVLVAAVGGLLWHAIAPRSGGPAAEKTPSPVTTPLSLEQQIQARMARAASLAADRVRNGYLDGSPTRDDVLKLLDQFIAAPRILPMGPEEAADGAYLAYKPADGGAIRVNVAAFEDPANADLDAYLDAAMVHELTHGAGRQVARNRLIGELDDETSKNPDGINLDGPEGARYRDRRKTLEALHARNDLEAFENEVMRYGRGMARAQGLSFRDYLRRQAQTYSYYQIFLDHLGPDDQLVDRDAVAVDLVMQGRTGGLGRQAGIMLVAYKEDVLTPQAFEETQQWLQQGESPMPHLPAAEMARFRLWLSKWVNDPKRYDAPFQPAGRAGILRRTAGALASVLIMMVTSLGLAAQDRSPSAPLSTPGAPEAAADRHQEFFNMLKAFEQSDLPRRIQDARHSVDLRLDRLLDERNPALSADANPDIPREGARKLLFVRLYSAIKLGAILDLPEDLRSDFEKLSNLEKDAQDQLAFTTLTLFPPVVDARNSPPLSDSELKTAYKRFIKVRDRWRSMLKNSAPTVELSHGLTDEWGTIMKWYVTLQADQDKDGTLHLGQLDIRTTGAWVYKIDMHERFQHFVVRNGGLWLVDHGPIRHEIKAPFFSSYENIPEELEIKDSDYPVRIGPQDPPPFLREPRPAPAMGSPPGPSGHSFAGAGRAERFIQTAA